MSARSSTDAGRWPGRLSRREMTLGVLVGGGVALAGAAACAERPTLPVLRASDPGPRSPREGYYVDVRRLIGGDGEIAPALRAAREAGLGAWIAPGRYWHSGETDVSGMRIEAAAGASIIAQGAGATMLRATGGLERLPDPIGRLRRGERAIRMAAPPSLERGEWLILFDPTDGSWHGARSYYRAGEWCPVERASGATVELASALADDYGEGRLQAYKARLATFELVGGTWDSGDRNLVWLSLCDEALVEVQRLRARADTAIMIDRCVGARVAIADGANRGIGRDDYLVCIANSFGARVSGHKLYARRHPVAIGGSDVVCGVPNRDCLVEGATLSNDPATGVACGDLHGNTELCGFAGCRIEGGIILGGADPIFRDCTVTARADGNLAELSEFKGGRIDLTGTTFFSPVVNVGGGRGLIDLGTQNNAFNPSTLRDVTLDLRRFNLAAPNLAANEAVIRVSNQGSPARLDINLQQGSFDLPRPVQLVRSGGKGGGTVGRIIISQVDGLPQRTILHVAEAGSRDRMTVRVAP